MAEIYICKPYTLGRGNGAMLYAPHAASTGVDRAYTSSRAASSSRSPICWRHMAK